MKLLRKLFHEIDTDGSGCLSLDELVDTLQSDEIQSVMAMLDLEVSDAVSFFELLDVDGSGSVEIDAFVMGCLRYMGKAKPVDIETLTQENRRMMDRFNLQAARVEEGLEMFSQNMRILISRAENEPPNGQLLGVEHRIKQTLDRDVKKIQTSMRELHVVVQQSLREHGTSNQAKSTSWWCTDVGGHE